MESSHFLLSSLLPQTTPSHCLQISARDLFVCLLGRVESPSKRSVDLLSRDLSREGGFDGRHEWEEQRTGIGVSSKLWHWLASDDGLSRRFLMSGCPPGADSDLRTILSFHSLSNSVKNLAYPDPVSIFLCVLKAANEMSVAAPFSLILWPSSVVLVAVGCALCLEALLCSLYAHGLKDGTVFFLFC
ncbi:hypothetical protein GQ457_11G004340 [Hibiscus cannabinus]